MASQILDNVFLDWPEISTYRPLDVSRREVRFLKIARGDSALENQNLSLVYDSLDDGCQYYALSYAWGEASQEHRSLIIDNERINTRATVFHFLNSLLHRLNGHDAPFNTESASDSILVWMDILCINQHDLQERNQQVAMFGDIYRGAVAVLAWVGQPDYGTEWMAKALMENKKTPLALTRRIEAFETYASQPFWSRMWIKQELVLARQIIFFWGKYCAPDINAQPQIFKALLRIPRTAQDDAYVSIAKAISDMRSRVLNNDISKRPHMSELIEAFGSASCSDPRDKIFALRSIAQDGGDFLVDYNVSVAELAWKSLGACDFDHSGQLKREPEYRYRAGLPSRLFSAMGLTIDELLNSMVSQQRLLLVGQFGGRVCTQGRWVAHDLATEEPELDSLWIGSSSFYVAVTQEGEY